MWNKFFKALFICGLVVSVSFILPTEESNALNSAYKLTPSQKHFTTIIKQLKTFRSVEWKSPVSMWVQIPSSQAGRASELADTIEDRARHALGQPFCVHIFVKKDQALARYCVY